MLFLPVLLKISCLLSSLTCCSLATTGATSTISDNLNNKYRLLFQQHVKNSVFHSPSLLSTPPLSPSSSSSSSSINPVIPVLETVYALDLSHIQHLAVNVSGFNGAVVDVRTAPSPPESNITGPPETAPPPTVLLSLVIEAPTSSLPSKNTKSSSSSSLLSGGDIQTRLTISGNKASLLISKLLSSSSSSSPPPIQGVVAVSILFPYSSTFATNYSLDISTSSSGIINMANIPPSSSKDYSIRLHTVRLSTADQQNQNQEWLRWEQADDESATVPGGVGAINLNNVAAHSLYLKSVLGPISVGNISLSQHLDVHAKNAFVSMRDVNFPSSDSISSRSDFGSDYSDGNLSHTWWSRSGGKKRKINHPPLPPPPSSPTAFITLFRGSFIGSIYNARHLNLTSTGSIPGYIQLDTSLLPTISSTSAISSASSSSLASRAYIFLEHGSSKINLKKFQPCARFVAHVVGGGGGGGSPIPSPPLGSVSVTGNTKDLVFEKNSPFAKSGYKRGGERDDDGGRTCEGGDDDAAPLVDSSVKIGRSILNFE